MRFQEIRDPIHGFVRLSAHEKKIVASDYFQRLRFISQLALTQFLYPSSCHTRFEHSLGVCEMATRIFEVVFSSENLTPEVTEALAISPNDGEIVKSRDVLRAAALLHDVGHLPFSHAAENYLLPKGQNHETLVGQILINEPMKGILQREHLDAIRVLKLAVGPKEAGKFAAVCPDEKIAEQLREFAPLDAVLSEIITGDFGADRMDYLLRDSHHLGVKYGHFDHNRLIDCLRILKHPTEGAPALGVTHGGLNAAEGLLLARYSLFSQVYYHPFRLAIDHHLKQFFAAEEQYFGQLDWQTLLQWAEPEVLTRMRDASRKASSQGHLPARRILKREHYRPLFSVPLEYASQLPKAVLRLLDNGFAGNYHKEQLPAKAVNAFLVRHNESTRWSWELSPLLDALPPAGRFWILVDPKSRLENKQESAKIIQKVEDFLSKMAVKKSHHRNTKTA